MPVDNPPGSGGLIRNGAEIMMEFSSCASAIAASFSGARAAWEAELKRLGKESDCQLRIYLGLVRVEHGASNIESVLLPAQLAE